MKYKFTLLKIVRTLLLALCWIFGAEQARGQYTASLVQKGGYYTALSKDNGGNLFVVRYNGTTYQLVRWPGGNPAGQTVLVNSLASSGADYPWAIAVNPTNNDVFVTNPDGGSGWQIIRVPGGTGTPTVVQSGNYYSAICLDINNDLLALEWNSGNGTYRVRRYSANGGTLLGTVYDGLTVPGDGSYPFAMDVDSHGNIYITNFYDNSNNSGEPGLVMLTYPGYAATPVQTGGRHFSGLYFDASDNLYTIEQTNPGSATYRIMKYTDPAGTGTQIYSPLSTDINFYPWGITEVNGLIYVNDGIAATDINGVGGANGQLLKLTPPPVSVVSVNRVGATPTNASSVQFTVTFSGAAANVTTAAFTATGLSGASVTSVTSVNSTTYTVTVNTGTGSGTLGLTVTGTDMGNTITNAPFSGGQTYTIDKTAPFVSSVGVPANGYYKGGDVLSFTVNFSESVTVTGTPSIPVDIDATTVQATYASGSGTSALVFSYTVQAGENDMDGIAVGAAIALNGGTIRDAVTNSATLTLNSVGNTNGVFVNTTIPSVVLSGTPALNASWTMTITFSEEVTGFTVGDINTTNAGLSNLNTLDNITYTVLVTPTADGAVSLTVPANGAQNIGGNGNSASNTINYTYDGTAPAVTSVSVPANGTYGTGNVLTFTVNFGENVTVTGTPSIEITIGATTVEANYISGSGGSALAFSYTILSGQQDVDGIAVGAAIALNGGTITDAATNNAALTLNSVGNTSAVLVDAVAPTVTSVTVPANGYYNAGEVLNFTVNFNENVTVTGTPFIQVTIGATIVHATYASGSGTSALVFRYTVQAGENDMNGIAVGAAITLNAGTIRDAATNDAVLTLNSVGNTSNVFVNTVIPTVTLSGTPVLNGPWTITITFSEAVNNFVASDISVTNGAASTLNTSDNITYTALITPTADGAVSINVPVNVAEQQFGGNGNSASNTINYTYDGTAPAVTSVSVPANGTYGTGDALTFTVNFGESVTVTGTPSIPITIGSSTVQADYTGGSGGSALTFSYTVSGGQQDVDGISVGTAVALNGGAIADAATNNAVLTLNNIGNTTAVLVDAVGPVVTSVAVPADGYYRAGMALSFTVNFDENVTVTGMPSMPITIGATNVEANYASGTGTSALVFSYTVVAGENDMDGIAVGSALALNGGTIKDVLNNDATLTLNNIDPTNNVFVNTVIPTVTLSTPAVLNGPWTMTITFSEAVTGFTMGDISATNASVSGLATSDNITYTVNVMPQADGTVSLSLPANVAVNIGNNGNAASNTVTYTYDVTAPAITSVAVPANGTYSNSDALDFTVNFSESVTVTGTPSFPVTIGVTAVQATYTGGSGTNALTFRYNVQNGDYDADGIAVGAAIALNGGTIQDAAANNAALTMNSVGNTSAVLVDAVPPAITSVNVPANGYYKAGDVLSFTVDFNENVTVTGTPSVPLTIGSTTVQAHYISGSGTSALVFSYTVVPGDNDMDGIAAGSALALNGGTVRDGLGNDAAPALNSVGNTNDVFVNTVIPTVTLSGTPVLNGAWTMTITFSETVTGFAPGDITATNATLSGLSTSDNITYTVLVTAGGDGAVTLSVPANVAENIGHNGNSASNTINYIHDGTGPVITSVTVPANGTYNAGDVLNFTVNYSENVTVTGTPSLPVEIGTTFVQAAYTGGSGSNALTFSYTVLSGQEDNDGIGVGAPLVLNGGTIKDAATNNAGTALSGIGNTSAVLVDALAPVTTSVTVPANGYYKAGDELYFTVQFSEGIVSAGSTATLPVTIGATTVQAAIFSTPAPNSIVFSYAVQAGEVDMDGITIGSAIVAGGAALRDAAGNNASLTLNNVGNTSNVFVLANRPDVEITGLVSVRQPWTVTITFSHAVTGFTLADLSLTNATASNLQTSDNITYTALISPVVEGGVSIEIPVSIAQDAAGNQNLPSNRLSYYYDPNPPVITSVEVPANGYYKQGDVLNFAVNWNEAVRNNVSPSSLTLPVIIGGTTVHAAYTGGYTTQRITFAYTVQAGQMDLDGIQLGAALQLSGTSEHVTDLSGNNAILTFNNVPSTNNVLVHTGRPAVTLTSAAAARVNAPFTVNVVFSEAVSQFSIADFTLSNATVSNLQTTDNITYTVQITPTADGTASISVPADAAVNVVGNGNTASNSISRTYDATPPAIAAGQSFTVSQYSAVGTVVGTVTATDASGIVQNWAIATDGSAGALQISTAGVISVRNTTLLDALAGTNVTLGLTVSDGLNTSFEVPVTVRVVFVNQPPTLDVINNVTICADVQTHTIQLSGASATEPGQTYTITVRSDLDIFDVLSVGAGDVLSYRLKANTPAGRATVAVTIRDNGGTTGGAVDSLRRSFTITVNALPVISITSDKGATVSKGDLVKLTATGGSTYVWAAADGIVGGQRTPVLEVRPQANTTYEVTAASAAGCTATGSFALSIVVDFKVDATNILTPNGDGRNDRWVIRNLDSYTDNEVKIFDRAGRMIYNRRNYSNDWDGTVNGSPLAEGTYYYILTIQNGAKTATGYITIVRDRY